MEKVIKIFQIDAFTNKAFGGNPAGVTFGNGLSDAEMQAIAKEMNLSETAFLCNSDKADYRLRWFTPATEVDLCGHATIASLHFLSENNILKNNSLLRFETRSGILDCKMEDGRYFMQIPVMKTSNYSGGTSAIIKALGIDKSELEESHPFVLLENGYLYLHVQSIKTLSNLKPNYKELLAAAENGKLYTAAVPFTLETIDKESFAHLRFFGPYYGIDEDPVTGSANGPLMLVLQKLGLLKNADDNISLQFEQGDFINRRGRINVTYSKTKNEIYISGNAVTVIKGDLFF